MPSDPYAALRALVRAEAIRNEPKPELKDAKQSQQPPKKPGR